MFLDHRGKSSQHQLEGRSSASPVAQTVKNPPAMKETQVWSWLGKIPWRREWLPTPVFFPEESRVQRSLAGYSQWGHKESDMTEWLTLSTASPGREERGNHSSHRNSWWESREVWKGLTRLKGQTAATAERSWAGRLDRAGRALSASVTDTCVCQHPRFNLWVQKLKSIIVTLMHHWKTIPPHS